MAPRAADVPSRRAGLLLLVAVGAGCWLLVACLGLLRQPGVPVVDHAGAPGDACAAGRAEGPVDVRAADLLACPDVLDGRQVRLVGEAVGDLLDGPAGRSWVQVNDDAYARAGPLSSHGALLGTNSGAAVLLPAGRDPAVLGGPGVRGDLLEVVGVFRVAADEDQGGPAVVASATRLLEPGAAVPDRPDRRLRFAAPPAVAVTAALLLAARRRGRG
jgi:hypothetical protein